MLPKSKRGQEMTAKEVCIKARNENGYSKTDKPISAVWEAEKVYIIAYSYADGILRRGGAQMVFAYTKDGEKVEKYRPFYFSVEELFGETKKLDINEFKDL